MVPFMRLALAAATVWGVNSIQVGDKVSVGIALAELCVARGVALARRSKAQEIRVWFRAVHLHSMARCQRNPPAL